jgi:hypothetical protein
MVLNLERISWRGEYYVDNKCNKVNPKPIGEAVVDTTFDFNQDFQKKAEERLLELQTKNKLYNKVNAYTIAYESPYGGDRFGFAFNFYEI